MSRECDKLESDDFKTEMKNEFELICKALNESKMPGSWCGCSQSTVCSGLWEDGKQWGWRDLEEKRRGRKDKRSANRALAGVACGASEGALPWQLHWALNLTVIFKPEGGIRGTLQTNVFYRHAQTHRLAGISVSSLTPLLLWEVK